MIDLRFTLSFALCALAAWRLAHLVAGENGPWNVVVRLRLALGSGVLGRMMDNFYGLSFLFALPPAIWMSNSWTGFLVQWLVLSAIACLLDRATQKRRGNRRLYPLSTAYLNKVISGV